MEIKIAGAPIEAGQTVNIELENRLLTLDFRRDGNLAALLEFRLVGDQLHITADVAVAGSEPRTFVVNLSESGEKEQGR